MDLNQRIVDCNRCVRLRSWCEEVARTRVRRYADETYWGKPVPGFGDKAAQLIILGLAPGAHGANRTGRVFTGDESGKWLYEALYQHEFANQPTSVHRNDGLRLEGAYITNMVRCAPPDNRPLPAEISSCQAFLDEELDGLHDKRVVLTLGKLAFDGYLRMLRNKGASVPKLVFAHGLEWQGEDGVILFASYHPSQQNTRTGRLTRESWNAVFARARELCGK